MHAANNHDITAHAVPLLPVILPAALTTHCSGCSQLAPDNESGADVGGVSTAGCHCLSCPQWYACSACAVLQSQAHRDAHPLHITYCVEPEDEQLALETASASPSIPPWSFVFYSLLWPFLKMFLPTVSVYLQVMWSAHKTPILTPLQASLSLITLACGQSKYTNWIFVSLNGTFLVVLMICLGVSSVLSIEILMFENMISSSILVDSRVRNFKSTPQYLSFICSFGFVGILYFGASTVAIALSASATPLSAPSNVTLPPLNSGAAQASAHLQQINAARLIFSNALAMAGGVYFIYSFFCEGAVLGRFSHFSLAERSPGNMKKMAAMKVVTVQQLELVVHAFVSASEIATRNVDRRYRVELASALNRRLCSPSHAYAASLHVDTANAGVIELAAFSPKGMSQICTACLVSCLQYFSVSGPHIWLLR